MSRPSQGGQSGQKYAMKYLLRSVVQLSHHPNQEMRNSALFWTRNGVCYIGFVFVIRIRPGPARCFLEGDIHSWVGEVVTPQDSVLEVQFTPFITPVTLLGHVSRLYCLYVSLCGLW